MGLFTSPHLFDATERVRINQKNISPQDFTLLYQEISEKEKVLGEKLTFFEVLTLMAFIYFQREKVDFAVIEAGLGGRLDATNILTPYAVVITSIAMDHMEYLGNSLEDIAREKAAIIKNCDKVVIGANTPGLIVQEPWIKVRGSFKNFDEENQKAAEEVLLCMGIRKHYKEARMPCRMEVLDYQGQVIILDAAHNPAGLEALFKSVKNQFPNSPLRCALAISKSKAIKDFAPLLSKYVQKVHILEPCVGHVRLASQETLYHALREGLLEEEKIAPLLSFQESINLAQTEAKKNQEILLFCGSFFLFEHLPWKNNTNRL